MPTSAAVAASGAFCGQLLIVSSGCKHCVTAQQSFCGVAAVAGVHFGVATSELGHNPHVSLALRVNRQHIYVLHPSALDAVNGRSMHWPVQGPGRSLT